MSTLTQTRRMPVKICIHPGGTTEVFYSPDRPAPAREETWPTFSGRTSRPMSILPTWMSLPIKS